MVKKLFLFIIIFLNVIFLNSKQQNRDEILLKQARHYSFQRNYKIANKIYKNILSSNPSNNKAINGYLRNLIALRNFQTAENFLNQHKKYLPQIDYQKWFLTIKLYQGDYEFAQKKAMEFLNNINDKIGYSIIAGLFVRFARYEFAQKIYLLARKKFKDNDIFIYELARAYEYDDKYKKAIKEFIRLLEKNPQQFYIVKKELLNIVENNNNLVDLLNKDKPENLKQIYVIALLNIGKYDKAYQIVRNLPGKQVEEIYNYLKLKENYDVLLSILKIYYTKIDNPLKKAKIKFDIAEIYYKKNNLEEAKKILNEIYTNPMIKRKYRELSFNCIKLLSKVVLKQQNNISLAVNYLKEAKKYTNNWKEKTDIDMQIIYLSILKSEYKQASDLLNNVMKYNKGYKKALFYKYLIYAMQNKKKADSLLVDLIIKLPDDKLTYEALYFNFYYSLCDTITKPLFVKAYQNKKLFYWEKAQKLLYECYNRTKKEEFLYLLINWGIDDNKKLPESLLKKEYKNKYIQTFVDYIKSVDDKNKIINFLTKHPVSIFSPKLRREINVYEQNN